MILIGELFVQIDPPKIPNRYNKSNGQLRRWWWRNGFQCYFQNAGRPKYNGVDTCSLLEEHDAHDETERFQDGSFHQIFETNGSVDTGRFLVMIFHSPHFHINIRLPITPCNIIINRIFCTFEIDFLLSPETLKCLAPVVFKPVSEQPNGCFGHCTRPDKENARQNGEDES